SKTWRKLARLTVSRSVVECGSPLPLFPDSTAWPTVWIAPETPETTLPVSLPSHTLAANKAMNKSIRFKLFLMMVLEFFIWGAWLPLIFGYLPSLGFKSWEQSWILNAFPIAAVVGMFFSNQFADRNFAAQ